MVPRWRRRTGAFLCARGGEPRPGRASSRPGHEIRQIHEVLGPSERALIGGRGEHKSARQLDSGRENAPFRHGGLQPGAGPKNGGAARTERLWEIERRDRAAVAEKAGAHVLPHNKGDWPPTFQSLGEARAFPVAGLGDMEALEACES